MRRDDRPYFDTEIGIPWDEYQLSCIISCELGIEQNSWRILGREMPEDLYDARVDEWAEKVARRASQTLRKHPSHHL